MVGSSRTVQLQANIIIHAPLRCYLTPIVGFQISEHYLGYLQPATIAACLPISQSTSIRTSTQSAEHVAAASSLVESAALQSRKELVICYAAPNTILNPVECAVCLTQLGEVDEHLK